MSVSNLILLKCIIVPNVKIIEVHIIPPPVDLSNAITQKLKLIELADADLANNFFF